MNGFLPGILDKKSLPVTLERFTTLEPDSRYQDEKFKLPADINDICVKAYKEYGTLLSDFYRTATTMKRDVQALKDKKPPAALLAKKQQHQFKTEVSEAFTKEQTDANLEKALKDLQRKIKSNKDWLVAKKDSIEPNAASAHIHRKLKSARNTSKRNKSRRRASSPSSRRIPLLPLESSSETWRLACYM